MRPLFKKPVVWRTVLAGMLVLPMLMLSPQAAVAQDPVYDVCLGEENCTANDFGDLALVTFTSKSSCVDHDGNGTYEMLFDFSINYASANATRYDIGAVISVDGLPASRLDEQVPTSVCIKDYLPAPLTPTDPVGVTTWPVDIGGIDYFWEGEGDPEDVCGDIPPNDQAVRSYTDVWVGCVDNYDAVNQTEGQDGKIDMNICVFYDNNAVDTCTSVYVATVGTTAKCGCDYYVTFPFTPTSVSLADFSARSSQGYLFGGLGLLLALGAAGSYWLYRRQTQTAA